ncbi:MAG: DUF3667 domain-containing protein [Parvularculaceae bacterium]|nr:DUF3667 domain-containing protein [Parvularculaceae bacterium]
MSLPEIEAGEDDGGVDIAPEGAIGAAIATGAALACLSCGAAIAGAYCANCGQKNDDMRRSSFVLFKDFVKDTFAFDSRMWRTLGLMAAAPGVVPTNYSHGRRSRYTPPVRLFLVVSFLFFLVLGLTHTMFVAVEVVAKSPAEIAADRARLEAAMREAGPAAQEAIAEAARENEAVVIDGETVDCDIKTRLRFFVRPQDVKIDEDKWRRCAESIKRAAKVEIENDESDAAKPGAQEGPDEADFERGFERVLAGVNLLVADPTAFNAGINTWLPRIMFFMAPVLALITAMFIRGRDALLFDHLVLALYSHAAAFTVIGAAILLGQFGVPNVFPAAMALLGVYFVLALRRAYKRGWIKTVLSSAFIGVLYLIVLTSVVGAILVNQIWRAAV